MRPHILPDSRQLLTVIVATTMALAGCQEEKHSYVPNMGDPLRTPTMVTRDVSTLISDSGYTRYHITTPLWNMFQDTSDPQWTFPDGIYLEQYDNHMRTAARMRCDSATYFEHRRLWRLDGHVVMINTAKDTFLTSQLFWDQTRSEIYSDSFMHITRADHIIEGYGFRSNQNMTAYTVHSPTAIIPISKTANAERPVTEADTSSFRPARNAPPEPASRREDRRRAFLGANKENSSTVPAVKANDVAAPVPSRTTVTKRRS